MSMVMKLYAAIITSLEKIRVNTYFADEDQLWYLMCLEMDRQVFADWNFSLHYHAIVIQP